MNWLVVLLRPHRPSLLSFLLSSVCLLQLVFSLFSSPPTGLWCRLISHVWLRRSGWGHLEAPPSSLTPLEGFFLGVLTLARINSVAWLSLRGFVGHASVMLSLQGDWQQQLFHCHSAHQLLALWGTVDPYPPAVRGTPKTRGCVLWRLIC